MKLQISLLNETGDESATIIHERKGNVQLQAVLDLSYTSSVVIDDFQNGDDIHVEFHAPETVDVIVDENEGNNDLTGTQNPDNLDDA